MKFFLSSYQFGDGVNEFLELTKYSNKRVAYISNARDYEPNEEKERWDLDQLDNLGMSVEKIDLREFFDKQKSLFDRLRESHIIYVRGGNTFALRYAMRLSGFDNILLDYTKENADKIYIGYSAGACVLSLHMEPLRIMDDRNINPYDSKETSTKGLGIIDFLFIPHYKSEYLPEGMAEETQRYAERKGIKYKVFRDNEFIVLNNKGEAIQQAYLQK